MKFVALIFSGNFVLLDRSQQHYTQAGQSYQSLSNRV
mgnify:CR=1 FL=1